MDFLKHSPKGILVAFKFVSLVYETFKNLRSKQLHIMKFHIATVSRANAATGRQPLCVSLPALLCSPLRFTSKTCSPVGDFRKTKDMLTSGMQKTF